MKKNIGTLDKIARILIAIAFTVLFFTGLVSGFVAIIGFVVVGQFVITGFINYCPVYHFFGINTCRRRETNRAFRNWD